MRAVGVAIALAYLRLLDDLDSLRASIVLASYQGYWNGFRSTLVEGQPDPERLPLLEVTGALDRNTQLTMVRLLYSQSIVSQAQLAGMGVGATAMLTFYRAYIRVPATSELWNAYTTARGVAPADSGVAVDQWAFAAAEGLSAGSSESFVDIVDTLAAEEPSSFPGGGGAGAPAPGVTTFLRPRAGAGACGPGTTWDGSACVYGTDIQVPGITSLRSRGIGWGWWVAGGALGLAALGFGWRIWKKRGRR